MLRILAGTLGWFLILFLLLLAGAVTLIVTEEGTRWLFAQAEKYAPIELQVDAVDGTLFHGLSLTGIQVHTEDTRVALDKVRLQLDGLALLKLTLRILDLSASGVTVDLPEPDPKPVEQGPRPELPDKIELPLTVILDQFRLTDLRLRQAGETIFQVDGLSFHLEAGPKMVRVGDLQLAIPDMEAKLNLELEPHDRYPLMVDGQWRFALPDELARGLETTHAEGEITIEGQLQEQLRLRHALRAVAELDTQITIEDLFGTPHARLNNRWKAFDYQLAPNHVVAIGPGSLEVRGTLDAWLARVEASAEGTGWPEARLIAGLRGSTKEVEIEKLDLTSKAGNLNLQGRASLGEAASWDLRAGVRDLSTLALGLDLDAAVDALQVASAGSLPYPISGNLEEVLRELTADVEIRELKARVENQELRGSGRGHVRNGAARIEDLLVRLGPQGVLRIEGEADLTTDIPFRLTLAADTMDLGFLVPGRQLALDRLRLGTSGLLNLESGTFAATVDLSDLATRIDGQPVSARAALALTESQVDIGNFDIFLPADGHLSATGGVIYGGGIEWDLGVSGRDVDPGAFLPDLAGSLTLELETRGAVPADGMLNAEVELSELRGELRGQPLDGAGAIVIDGNRVEINRLDLSMGANHLHARGSIDEIVALDLSLDAPELDRVLPALAGRIGLEANIGGTMDSPRITAKGQGSGLRYQDLALDALSLELNAGIDPEAPAELTLKLSGIRAGLEQIDEIQVGAQGRASDHRLALAVDAADFGRLNLSATGGYQLEQMRWTGRLESLALEQPLAGDWSLQQPVSISAGLDQSVLNDLCLVREQSRLCIGGDWNQGSGSQAQASLENLDLAWLEPVLPPGTLIEGTLSAAFQMSLDAAQHFQAELNVAPASGAIRLELGDGSQQTFPYSDLRLMARVDDRTVDTELGVSFLDDGEAEATLRMEPEGASYRIDGRIQAGLESLGWLGAFSPEIQDVRGRLRADLLLGGLLDAPLIEGGIRLEEAGVSLPEPGIQLGVPLLEATVVSTEEMHLAGELRSGGEALRIKGQVGFTEQGPRAEIRVRGERFLAVDRHDIRARISPDLTVTLLPELLTVRGEMLVPSALIRPPDLPPGSVSVSRDEVVLGEEVDTEPAMPMDVRVRVVLGDDVRFDGFDLVARFSGDLDLVDQPGRPLQLFGDIEIPDGRYKAYGQDLQLDQGRITFQGPPESPALDLRAVRRVSRYDVVVGVEIGGTPDALRSRVYSDPAMDDTEAMAFLLTGRPLSGASESEGNLIAGAAAAWGLEQAGLITQRLGNELGLDVGLDADSGLDRSALTIGKYLSPRLLLRYSVGLFDDSYKVLLRYELTRSLSVETSSGAEGQGIDLIYRIER